MSRLGNRVYWLIVLCLVQPFAAWAQSPPQAPGQVDILVTEELLVEETNIIEDVPPHGEVHCDDVGRLEVRDGLAMIVNALAEVGDVVFLRESEDPSTGRAHSRVGQRLHQLDQPVGSNHTVRIGQRDDLAPRGSNAAVPGG